MSTTEVFQLYEGESHESGQDPIRQIPLADIRPSPENDRLYRPVDPNDPEIQSLAANIAERGILVPLVMSADGFLLSGHRRRVAAELAGLEEVPCQVLDVSRREDPDAFLVSAKPRHCPSE